MSYNNKIWYMWWCACNKSTKWIDNNEHTIITSLSACALKLNIGLPKMHISYMIRLLFSTSSPDSSVFSRALLFLGTLKPMICSPKNKLTKNRWLINLSWISKSSTNDLLSPIQATKTCIWLSAINIPSMVLNP